MKINKNKTVLMLLLIAMLLAPAVVFAVNKITNINDTFALTYSIPAGYTTFTDANLYDCVASKYKSDHPDTNISQGLTDAQLQQMESLSCESRGITNAKGIEKMAALSSLHLQDNRLTSINLANNTALVDLWLYDNQLTSIDVSHNTVLTGLYTARPLSPRLMLLLSSKRTPLRAASSSSPSSSSPAHAQAAAKLRMQNSSPSSSATECISPMLPDAPPSGAAPLPPLRTPLTPRAMVLPGLTPSSRITQSMVMVCSSARRLCVTA